MPPKAVALVAAPAFAAAAVGLSAGGAHAAVARAVVVTMTARTPVLSLLVNGTSGSGTR